MFVNSVHLPLISCCRVQSMHITLNTENPVMLENQAHVQITFLIQIDLINIALKFSHSEI